MTFLPRLIVIALAAYGAASLAASAIVILCWRRVAAADRSNADRLFKWRVAPAAGACAVSLLTVFAFARFEPRAGLERTGFLLLAMAVIAIAVLITAAVRLAAGHLLTRRALRAWLVSAEPAVLPGVPIPASIVASHFPIVAIVGILRPRMIIARSVMDACSPNELCAIVAHERWHLRRRDNARRALLAAVPDAVAWLPFSRRASLQWHVAAERAADDAAVASMPAGRVHLASALLRVARLAPPNQRAVVPVSALYRGENIQARIRRIFDDSPASVAARPPGRLLISAALLIGLSLLALHPIHELIETAVGFLP